MDRMRLSNGRDSNLQISGFGVMTRAIRGHRPRVAGGYKSSPSRKFSFQKSRSTDCSLDIRRIKLRRLIDPGDR